MRHDFFLSYSSVDYRKGKKDDLCRFFTDLEARITQLGRGDGGFFAARTIETGADWKDELVSNLKSCHVIVPLYSPNYFKSPHCGREWKVFFDRFQENKRNPPPDVVKPEIILPVLWTAELLEIPKEVAEVQDKTTEYPMDYQTSGLSYLMRSSRKAGYDDFVHKFGLRLAQMLTAQGDPKVRPIPEYDQIDPVFPPDAKRGLTFVRYVFMAGLQDEMRPHRPNWNGYGIYLDRKDWRPCFPEVDRKAGEIASSLAAAAGKAVEFIEPGDKLLDRLKYARDLENIVVIVVDPWSMTLPSLQNLATRIDVEPLPNSALLVMWNRGGAEAGGLPLLNVPGDPRFDTREGRKEYIVTVNSHDEFRQKLESFFNTFREAMIVNGKIRSAEEGTAGPQPILKG
jgi:FxsC-like protein